MDWKQIGLHNCFLLGSCRNQIIILGLITKQRLQKGVTAVITRPVGDKTAMVIVTGAIDIISLIPLQHVGLKNNTDPDQIVILGDPVLLHHIDLLTTEHLSTRITQHPPQQPCNRTCLHQGILKGALSHLSILSRSSAHDRLRVLFS